MSIIYTGAELIKTAIDDWKGFSNGNETLMEYFPELEDVLPNKKYKADSQLSDISEVEADGTK